MFEFKLSFDREAAPDNWEFGLSGFRSFNKRQEFEFSQVSFVTGGNHTGKSTILRALSILLDTLKSGGGVLRLDGRNGLMHQIPSLEQLVPWGVGEDDNHEIELSIKYDQISFDWVFQRMSHVNEAWLKEMVVTFCDEKKPVKLLSLTWVENKKAKVPEKREQLKWKFEIHKLVFGTLRPEAISQQKRLLFLWNSHLDDESKDENLSVWFAEFDKSGRKKSGNYRSVLIEGGMSFADFGSKLGMKWMSTVSKLSDAEVSELKGSKKSEKSVVTLGDFDFWIASTTLSGLVDSLPVMRHLGSQRDVAPRVATVGTSPYRIFREVSQQRVHGMFDKGEAFLRRWMTQMGIGDDFDINQVSGLGYSARLKKLVGMDSGSNWCNLADLSMGEAQIFRILLTLAQAINEIGDSNKWVICVLEEPDSNLHPNTQSALLDALVDAANESRHLQILMETHSEILVRSLQLKVKEGQLRKEAVLINYLEEEWNSTGGQRRITLDKNGRTSADFGSGFIDESGELAIRLL